VLAEVLVVWLQYDIMVSAQLSFSHCAEVP
jgi:hypothetical protein